MTDITESELVVLGAGPGGYAAAFRAADKGLQVTLIEASPRPGGTCLNIGCIPSKTLLHASKLVVDARDAAAFGLQFGNPKIDLDTLRGVNTRVIDTLSRNLAELCKRRKVEYIQARATFEDPNTLLLADGSRRRFKQCIIAVGSIPTRPPTLNLESKRVMDSSGALELAEIPEAFLVVGGGYIGLELGCVYAALGSKVTVVELTDGLLPGVDRDLVRPLQARLEKQFHKIYLNAKVTGLREGGKGIIAAMEGPEITDREVVFGRVLVAVGRRPNSRGLGLEKAGVEIDEKGFVKVDGQRRTSVSHIFAIGDVAGEPMLAHKASHEGLVAAEAAAGESTSFDSQAIPAVVFTDPSIAWCGLTETEAKKQNREVKVARFPWAASGRAVSLGRTEGLTKLLIDPSTERVLGVAIVGEGAGEMIAEGVVAVEMGSTARDLALSIHPHPTLSETLGEAAESFYGPTTHIYKPRR
jgi:dihydrolipoamide dehydrogenase